MNNKDYWRMCISELEQCTELESRDILCSRAEKCTDARYVLVYFLSQRLTDNEISEVSGMSRQRVNWLKNHFELGRAKWSVKEAVSRLKDKLNGKLIG